MSPSFEHRAEQSLLRAVHSRRRRRYRQRGLLAAVGVALLATALWLGPLDHPTAPPHAPAADITLPKAFREIASHSESYTLVRTRTQSSVVVVRTGEAPLPVQIDDRELFAVFPNAVIRIGENDVKELIWPQ